MLFGMLVRTQQQHSNHGPLNLQFPRNAIRVALPAWLHSFKLLTSPFLLFACRVPIQACIGVKVIASEAIAPYRKDVSWRTHMHTFLLG